jgi:maltooligosyltrehalose synthase
MLDNTPYVVQKFEAGEVHFKDGAAGWLMDDGEFRPLMDDAMEELHSAGLVSNDCVSITRDQRDEYVAKSMSEYRLAQAQRSQEQIDEERWEARAAMGPGVEMVNLVTGERFTT